MRGPYRVQALRALSLTPSTIVRQSAVQVKDLVEVTTLASLLAGKTVADRIRREIRAILAAKQSEHECAGLLLNNDVPIMPVFRLRNAHLFETVLHRR